MVALRWSILLQQLDEALTDVDIKQSKISELQPKAMELRSQMWKIKMLSSVMLCVVLFLFFHQ